jgi:hypothetical protein
MARAAEAGLDSRHRPTDPRPDNRDADRLIQTSR